MLYKKISALFCGKCVFLCNFFTIRNRPAAYYHALDVGLRLERWGFGELSKKTAKSVNFLSSRAYIIEWR